MSLPANAPPVVFVLTADRIKAVPFYRDVLGLKLMGEDSHAATFDLGNRTPLRLTDLPDSVQTKLLSRRRLRGSLRSLSLLGNDGDDL